MAGQKQVVVVAPLADRFCESLRKHTCLAAAIVISHLAIWPATVGRIIGQFRQTRDHVITEHLLKTPRQARSPRQAAIDGPDVSKHPAVVRFVGKNSGNGFAEMLTDFLPVFLVRHLDELADGFFAEGIEVAPVVEPGAPAAGRGFEGRTR